MNPSVKEKWLEALRSGEYKQAVGRLRWPPTGGFCCMGVLCDLYHKETGDGTWVFIPATPNDHQSHSHYTFLSEDGFAPDAVSTWAGLAPYSTESGSELHVVAHLNDFKKQSFKTIAQYIEDNF